MTNIKVSVIIPVYNTEKYLKECLDSVINQSLKEIEIICIDDGSTDDSLKILQEYERKDQRLRVLQQKNSGSGIARNNGIKKCVGKYISFLDADDYYPSIETLKILFDVCERNKVDIAGGGISLRKQNEVIPAIKRGRNNFFENEGIIKYIDVQYDYGYQRYIFSRKLLLKNNILFPQYIRFQDPPFLVQAMICAQKFYAVKEETYCYRWGHQNINWNFKRTNDMVTGILDVLKLSIKSNLINLFNVCINRIDKEYYNIINKSLNDGNIYLFNLLIEFSFIVNKNIKFVENKSILFSGQYLPAVLVLRLLDKKDDEKIKQLQEKIRNIESSRIYKLGEKVTFMHRKINGCIKCYREHGLKYTINRVFFTLRLNFDILLL